MLSRSFSRAACALLLGSLPVHALDVDLTSTDSIKQATSQIVYDMVKFYTGNHTGDVPGNLPDPYFWWEAGAMFGALVDYWYYTGDTTYNEITTQALQFQVGNNDYMPPNQTKTEGNDDQAFWALAAMEAAEVKYPDPPAGQPQWLALAQAVFNTQVPRWDAATCGGGLRWQIFTFNNGFNYKNTISNGCFFNLASRLARYTGNTTYSDWAEQMWDWIEGIGLMSLENGNGYHFYDGTDSSINCSQVNHIQWTYNAGVHLLGAATMWNISQSDQWRDRTTKIMNGLSVFLAQDQPNVLFEVACENNGKCNVDQQSFKAYLSRWIAASIKVAPWTEQQLQPILQASAKAAAQQCSGGDNGRMCGLKWTAGATWDGTYGVGQQMAALEVIQGNLYSKVAGPVTNNTGGTSKGDPSAGTSSTSQQPQTLDSITTGDKAGAGILTTIILFMILGGAYWMVA